MSVGQSRLVGARVARREDPRLLTGQGSYVDDPRPARMLYAAFLRSPHAHARIRRLDASAALALPGVAAVLTGEDIARSSKPVRAACMPSARSQLHASSMSARVAVRVPGRASKAITCPSGSPHLAMYRSSTTAAALATMRPSSRATRGRTFRPTALGPSPRSSGSCSGSAGQ